MKHIDFKLLIAVELALLISIAFFSIDFLPRNYNEFQRICLNQWSKDPNQLQICMEPYFRQINLDKHAINISLLGLILVPVAYTLYNKKK
ncbi:MAG TPA: hypothetical protein VKC54_00780 [Patescibacteria group bacterium]|nr:hypothetical protein [Patescibacteria group bacterium]